MTMKLNGKWWYQSFCPLAAVVDGGTTKVPAQIAGPWTPLSVMELATDENGKVTGTATLVGPIGPIELKISGSVTPALAKIPEGIELSVSAEKFSAAYSLRGFSLTNTDHLVGTVVAISNDLGRQPVGTAGPFVMFPVK